MIAITYNDNHDRFEIRNADETKSIEPNDGAKLQDLVGVRWSAGTGPRTAWCPATIWHAMELGTRFGQVDARQVISVTNERNTGAHIEKLWLRRGRFLGALTGEHQLMEGRKKLFTHQAQAVAALHHLDYRGLLGDEMGLGKTKTSIWCARNAGAQKILVLCPATIKENWREELAAEGIEAHIVKGTPKKRCLDLQHAINQSARAIICNYELLLAGSQNPGDVLPQLIAYSLDGFVICDESHYLKSQTAKRTRAVQQLAPKHILLLTGTPIRSYCVDLYSQISLIRPDFFRTVWEFKDQFTVEVEMDVGKGKKAKVVVADKNPQKLKGIMDTLMVRRLKKDVLNLPPVIETTFKVELDAESRKAYKHMKERWIYHFGDLAPNLSTFDKTAQSAVEQALRLEQICSGYLQPLPVTPGEFHSNLGDMADQVKAGFFPKSAKILRALELVVDLLVQKRRVLVYSKFNRPLDHLWEGVREHGPTAVLTGDTKVEDRQTIIRDFNTGPPAALLCQVRIAEGWNAPNCQDVIFLSRDWSPAVNEQAIARCHRIGQKGTVNVYNLIVEDSIEEYIFRRIAAKERGAALTLGDLQEAIK